MRRVAIVTGATGGIGRACVQSLCANGWTVVASGTDERRLSDLARSFDCEIAPTDLSNAQATIAALSDIEADTVVHCAGFLGSATKIHEMDAEEVSRIITTNVIGTIHLIRATVPGMIARKNGHLVLCGSAAAHAVGSSPAVYSASKAAVAALASGLRLDVHGSNIRVTELAPGRVATGVHDQLSAGVDLYSGFRCLEPADVARYVSFIVNSPAHINATHVELLPTDQVFGGSSFARVPQ